MQRSSTGWTLGKQVDASCTHFVRGDSVQMGTRVFFVHQHQVYWVTKLGGISCTEYIFAVQTGIVSICIDYKYSKRVDSLLQFLLIKGEGNAEDAVIILQQQQGEGWAEV